MDILTCLLSIGFEAEQYRSANRQIAEVVKAINRSGTAGFYSTVYYRAVRGGPAGARVYRHADKSTPGVSFTATFTKSKAEGIRWHCQGITAGSLAEVLYRAITVHALTDGADPF